MRKQLGVDVQLADPARDELCVLAAEVEDHHRVGLWLDRVRGPLGWWHVQRRFQVRLDLGVIWGQHAMTGVGELAVNRAPALLATRAPIVAGWLLVGRLAQSHRRCRWVAASLATGWGTLLG